MNTPPHRGIAWLLLGASLMPAGCRETGSTREGGDQPGAVRTDSVTSAAGEIAAVQKARAALDEAGIPLYPGAEGLDWTEFHLNNEPFVAVDFFILDPPEQVVAFYDRELEAATARRTEVPQLTGMVRYELHTTNGSIDVKPWLPTGSDSVNVTARFDRRDQQGVSTTELDAYGKLLSGAKTRVLVRLPKSPETAPSAAETT